MGALRERVLHNAPSMFDFTKAELEEMRCYSIINRDDPMLSNEAQYNIKQAELDRLKWLAVHKNYKTEHCLLPSILAPPSMQEVQYRIDPKPGPMERLEGTTSGEYMGPRHFDPRQAFRVPLVTGPY